MALEICRICGSDQSLKHVFREGNAELLDQIRLCANIQIHEDDFLPKYVCDTCEQGLAFSYRLRKRGEETERKLRQELLAVSTSELYDLDKDIQASDGLVSELDEENNDELWVHDEDNIQIGELDEFDSATDESNVYVLQSTPEQESDETKQWISVQEEVLSENIEILQDVHVEYEEVSLTDLVCDSIEERIEQNHDKAVETFYQRSKGPQIECETCGEMFDTRPKYSEHIRIHGDLRYQCLICDKWFNVRYRFEQHMKNHSSEKGAYPCTKCSNSYTIQSNLERHVRSVHNGEKRFQCTECGTSFGRADILKMHMAKHSNERNVECEICQKRFKTAQHLHYHKKSHVEKSKRPKKRARVKPKADSKQKTRNQVFLCEYCDKISHHRTTHVNHMRTHTGEKPYKCDSCDKAFRTSHARSNHMLLHTDERPHICKVCGMSFRQTAHLKSHMLIHAGIKNHVCDFCQKAFTMKNNLMVHMRMHNGEASNRLSKVSQQRIEVDEEKELALSQIDEECNVDGICDENLNDMDGNFENVS